MLHDMKFAAAVLSFLALLCSALPSQAQGLGVDNEELRRLQGEVLDLRDANADSKRKISELTRKVETLQKALYDSQEKQILKQGDFITRDDIKKVLDEIREVDNKRENDRKVILEAFEKLEKSLTSSTTRRPQREPRETPRGGSSDTPKDPEPRQIEGTFYPHKVQNGETFGHILEAYNDALEKEGRRRIKYSEVKQANPKLDLNRIRVGQEILLPVPDKK